jgi:uncharacterized protein YicC (UPF0701 family)
MTIKQDDFDKIVAKHMDHAMEKYVVSKYSEWSGLITDIQKDTAEMKRDIKEIRDQVQPLLSEAEFWEQFWKRIRQGGNILTWAVGVIAAALILTGQAKVLFLAWLSSKTF